MNIIDNNKLVQNTIKLKFLGLLINSTVSWNEHIEVIFPKLNQACFVLKIVRSVLSLQSLKMVYYAYFHFILTYGLIFWGNSTSSTKTFKLQKRIIRIIVAARPRASCRAFFRNLQILPLVS
jgi:hypothetical protein